MQSKKFSLLEAFANTLIGFLITLACSPFVYWACDVTVSSTQLWVVTLWFTGISVARSYILRRLFNKIKK